MCSYRWLYLLHTLHPVQVAGYNREHWEAELEKAKEAMEAWRCKRWLAKDALSKFKKSRSRSRRR